MKREVIFRGWSPITQTWVYGTGFHQMNGGTCGILNGAGTLTHVQPGTIGEWTGESTSELGFRRIYEGDFVAVRHGSGPNYEGPFFILWDGHGFEMRDSNNEPFPLSPWNSIVIGNATENSELRDVETKIRTLEEFRNMI